MKPSSKDASGPLREAGEKVLMNPASERVGVISLAADRRRPGVRAAMTVANGTLDVKLAR
jgi:hypothetical protein